MTKYEKLEAIGLIKGHASRKRERDKLNVELLQDSVLDGEKVERYISLSRKVNIVESAFNDVLQNAQDAEKVKRYILANIENRNAMPVKNMNVDLTISQIYRIRKKIIANVAKKIEIYH